MESWDLVVVGGGLAGLTAGLFGARYGLRTLVLERLIPGGQIVNAERVENYPGFPQGISGAELGPLVQEQAQEAGAEVRLVEATGLRAEEPYWIVETPEGPLRARAVVLACGSSPRRLGVPGEAELYGRGVSHCATCDGPFFAGEEVAVVGGGDSALDEALTLAGMARRVYLLHRRETLRAQQALQDRVLTHPRIRVVWNAEVLAVEGDREVTGLRYRDRTTGEERLLPVRGVFIYVGLEPNTAWLRGVVPLDNGGHIAVDLEMRTPVPGLFAAGDVRQGSVAQLASCVGDGATSALSAVRYIRGRTWPQ